MIGEWKAVFIVGTGVQQDRRIGEAPAAPVNRRSLLAPRQTSAVDLDRLYRADDPAERAGVELRDDGELAGRLRLGHSDRGRAEGASGEARVGGGEGMVVGRPEGDLGAEDFLEGRRGRRA